VQRTALFITNHEQNDVKVQRTGSIYRNKLTKKDKGAAHRPI
jgi:hypothetical protein